MKKLLLNAVAVLVGCTLIGCALFQNADGSLNVPKATDTIKQLASFGTAKAVKANAGLTNQFVAVEDSLAVLVKNSQVTPEDVNKVFADLKAKDPLAYEDLQLALFTYNTFFQKAISQGINSNVIASVVANGLNAGIAQGLSNSVLTQISN